MTGSIVDQIKAVDLVCKNPKLSTALSKYHEMVEKKKIIPRENQLNRSGQCVTISVFNKKTKSLSFEI